MNRVVIFSLCLSVFFVGIPLLAASAHAAGPDRITLPKPDGAGGKPLMQALAERKTTRGFSDNPVSERDLSNLLWAAWGVNRPDQGLHTAPTARNSQALAVYAVLESGVWLYEPKEHALSRILDKDVRSKFGNPPLVLLYAAPKDDRFAGMHVGSLYQNAGLYCASVGLGNVVKATGANALDGELKLPDGYMVYIVQPIGWPK